ncbi:MAG TPA: hypothetical protein DD727_04620, partial [Clostridiales bacterium]|nr:hypothetical protein [Clostridiales bacterium]
MFKESVIDDKKYGNYVERERIRENLLLFKQKFFYELLYGNFYDEEDEIAARIEFLDIPLHYKGVYFIDLIDLNDCLDKSKQDHTACNPSFTMHLFDRISELLDTNSICIHIKEALYALVRSYPMTDTEARYRNSCFMDNIKNKLEKLLNSKVEVFASLPVFQIKRLRYVFEDMMEEQKNSSAKYENVVDKIMEIIRKNYSTRITMEKIASEVFLSA